jgi:hypothetical protein
MFLQLKAQAMEVSDDQVVAQAIKALCVGPLHSHLVMERSKTITELYEILPNSANRRSFTFRKLEQQWKAPKHDEALRLVHYNDNNQRNYAKHV